MLPFDVDTRSPTPIYAQLDRAIRASIATGALQPGMQLPTVRQLAVDLAVNANTVARVYAQLERDGILETRRGRSEEHTSELQSRRDLVCRLLLEKKKKKKQMKQTRDK